MPKACTDHAKKRLALTIRKILTNNLNGAQFGNAADVEEQQRRRFKRKQESGYVGNGYNFINYPYMVGALGAGTITQTQPNEEDEHSHDAGSEAGEPNPGATTATGMGDGGTAASATGAAGGSPA